LAEALLQVAWLDRQRDALLSQTTTTRMGAASGRRFNWQVTTKEGGDQRRIAGRKRE